MTDAAKVIERARELQKATTQHYINIVRYDHGGGRVFQETPNGKRQLIADFYDEVDREWYLLAVNVLPALLDVLEESVEGIWCTYCDCVLEPIEGVAAEPHAEDCPAGIALAALERELPK